MTTQAEISSTDNCIYGYFMVDSINDIRLYMIFYWANILMVVKQLQGKENGSPIYTKTNDGKAYQISNGNLILYLNHLTAV